MAAVTSDENDLLTHALHFLLLYSSVYMMDDAGNESSMKNNEEIKFSIKWTADKSDSLVEVVALKRETLAQALVREFPKMNVQQRIFWANVTDHEGRMASVNPFTFLCGRIHPSSTVQWKSCKEKLYILRQTTQVESYSLFFIESRDRENLEHITNLDPNKFRLDDLCVDASHGQSMKEALENDGRFKNVDRFKLQHGPGNLWRPRLSEKASSFSDVTFSVKVTKRAQSDVRLPQSSMAGRKSKEEDISCSSMVKNECCPGGSGSAHADDNEHQEKEKESSKETSTQMRGLFIFSKPVEQLTDKELFNEMEQRMISHARSVLVPDDQQHQYEKFISDLGVAQFATQHSVARPARLTKVLALFVDSVGRIWCGSVSATCFLLSKSVVITNYHVIKMILNARRSSDPEAHRHIFVDFNYEEPGQSGSDHTRIQVSPLTTQGNLSSSHLDYAILQLEQSLEEKTPLGQYVRTLVPEKGLVTIIGHPDSREKLEETSRILPEKERTKEIDRRVEEKENRCQSYPSDCVLTQLPDDSVKCIHMHRVDIGNNRRVMTYDVGSMFEGSSGSPVFNMSGHIVALHSAGYRLNESRKKTSLIEFGVTFYSIIKELRENGNYAVVKQLFPNCDSEDMDLGN